MAALTKPHIWNKAPPDIKAKALPFIDEAFEEVMQGEGAEGRRVRLSRLPPHIAQMVRDRILATWKARITFATDDSPEGLAEARREAEARGGTFYHLAAEGMAVVSEKSPG